MPTAQSDIISFSLLMLRLFQLVFIDWPASWLMARLMNERHSPPLVADSSPLLEWVNGMLVSITQWLESTSYNPPVKNDIRRRLEMLASTSQSGFSQIDAEDTSIEAEFEANLRAMIDCLNNDGTIKSANLPPHQVGLKKYATKPEVIPEEEYYSVADEGRQENEEKGDGQGDKVSNPLHLDDFLIRYQSEPTRLLPTKKQRSTDTMDKHRSSVRDLPKGRVASVQRLFEGSRAECNSPRPYSPGPTPTRTPSPSALGVSSIIDMFEKSREEVEHG